MMKRIVQVMVVVVALILSSVVWLGWARAISSASKRRDAATIYRSQCASCHGKDGRANTLKAKFNGAKDLTKASWQESTSDEHIFNAISNGQKKMPAFGNKLSQAEIESLVAYVRRFKRSSSK
jgi:mono/diheme cytochrome c family protein